MKPKDLDKRFDSGEDITKYLDLEKATRPGQDQKRVNVDIGKTARRHPSVHYQGVDRGAIEGGINEAIF